MAHTDALTRARWTLRTRATRERGVVALSTLDESVLELCRSYPGRAAQIRRIFRLARRMEPTVVG